MFFPRTHAPRWLAKPEALTAWHYLILDLSAFCGGKDFIVVPLLFLTSAWAIMWAALVHRKPRA